ncbi:MAG: hypothetical protein MJ051_07365 [Akkermansia sp.]|nr:hypothetical protein [Akkermansia sp.]
MKLDTEKTVSTTTPAALSAALRGRLLGAMTAAAEEERADRATEALLHRLTPAPLSARLAGRVGVQMCLAAAEERSGQRARSYRSRLMWHRLAAAASVVFFVSAGSAVLYSGNAAADTTQGLMSRCVLDTRAEQVEWHDDAPVRSYLVTYEDEFVMDADEDMTVMVRVPNRAEVQVDEDVL